MSAAQGRKDGPKQNSIYNRKPLTKKQRQTLLAERADKVTSFWQRQHETNRIQDIIDIIIHFYGFQLVPPSPSFLPSDPSFHAHKTGPTQFKFTNFHAKHIEVKEDGAKIQATPNGVDTEAVACKKTFFSLVPSLTFHKKKQRVHT